MTARARHVAALLCLLLGIPCSGAVVSPPAFAQDEELDELLEEFPDAEREPVEPAEAEVSAAARDGELPRLEWDLRGSIGVAATYNYARRDRGPGRADFTGLSRMRVNGRLELDAALPRGFRAGVSGRAFRDYAFARNDRSRFSDEVLDQLQSELELQQLYLQGALSENVDVKIGRQILALGFADEFRVVDIVNPLDNRDPGLVDLEDLRLPVAMSRLDYYAGPWTLTSFAVHEARYDEMPQPGSDFFPEGLALLPEDIPANGGSDTEFGAQLKGVFRGLDVALVAARYFDDTAHVDRELSRLEHSRVSLVGGGMQAVRGPWLVKLDAARLHGLEFSGTDRKLARTDVVVGAEYAGLTDMRFSAELFARSFQNFQSELEVFPDLAQRNRFGGAFRYRGSFLNARLVTNVVAFVFGTQAEEGAALRIDSDYELRDGVRLGVGALVFQRGDITPFNFIDQNDRVFCDLEISF